MTVSHHSPEPPLSRHSTFGGTETRTLMVDAKPRDGDLWAMALKPYSGPPADPLNRCADSASGAARRLWLLTSSEGT